MRSATSYKLAAMTTVVQAPKIDPSTEQTRCPPVPSSGKELKKQVDDLAAALHTGDYETGMGVAGAAELKKLRPLMEQIHFSAAETIKEMRTGTLSVQEAEKRLSALTDVQRSVKAVLADKRRVLEEESFRAGDEQSGFAREIHEAEKTVQEKQAEQVCKVADLAKLMNEAVAAIDHELLQGAVTGSEKEKLGEQAALLKKHVGEQNSMLVDSFQETLIGVTSAWNEMAAWKKEMAGKKQTGGSEKEAVFQKKIMDAACDLSDTLEGLLERFHLSGEGAQPSSVNNRELSAMLGELQTKRAAVKEAVAERQAYAEEKKNSLTPEAREAYEKTLAGEKAARDKYLQPLRSNLDSVERGLDQLLSYSKAAGDIQVGGVEVSGSNLAARVGLQGQFENLRQELQRNMQVFDEVGKTLGSLKDQFEPKYADALSAEREKQRQLFTRMQELLDNQQLGGANMLEVSKAFAKEYDQLGKELEQSRDRQMLTAARAMGLNADRVSPELRSQILAELEQRIKLPEKERKALFEDLQKLNIPGLLENGNKLFNTVRTQLEKEQRAISCMEPGKEKEKAEKEHKEHRRHFEELHRRHGRQEGEITAAHKELERVLKEGGSPKELQAALKRLQRAIPQCEECQQEVIRFAEQQAQSCRDYAANTRNSEARRLFQEVSSAMGAAAREASSNLADFHRLWEAFDQRAQSYAASYGTRSSLIGEWLDYGYVPVATLNMFGDEPSPVYFYSLFQDKQTQYQGAFAGRGGAVQANESDPQNALLPPLVRSLRDSVFKRPDRNTIAERRAAEQKLKQLLDMLGISYTTDVRGRIAIGHVGAAMDANQSLYLLPKEQLAELRKRKAVTLA